MTDVRLESANPYAVAEVRDVAGERSSDRFNKSLQMRLLSAVHLAGQTAALLFAWSVYRFVFRDVFHQMTHPDSDSVNSGIGNGLNPLTVALIGFALLLFLATVVLMEAYSLFVPRRRIERVLAQGMLFTGIVAMGISTVAFFSVFVGTGSTVFPDFRFFLFVGSAFWGMLSVIRYVKMPRNLGR